MNIDIRPNMHACLLKHGVSSHALGLPAGMLEPEALWVQTLNGDAISAILILPGNREGLDLLLILSFLVSFLPGQLIHVVLRAQLDLGLCHHMPLKPSTTFSSPKARCTHEARYQTPIWLKVDFEIAFYHYARVPVLYRPLSPGNHTRRRCSQSWNWQNCWT